MGEGQGRHRGRDVGGWGRGGGRAVEGEMGEG